MARAGFFDVVIDPNGRPIRGVTVTVYDTGTTTPYSGGSIWAGPTGATVLPNPFTANDQGEVQFWLAAPTRVDLAYSKNGYTGETETVDTSDSGALLPDANIPATIARDTEVTAAVAAEAALRTAADALLETPAGATAKVAAEATLRSAADAAHAASGSAHAGTYAPSDPTLVLTYNPDGTLLSVAETVGATTITTTFTYNADLTIATSTRLGVVRTYSYSAGNLVGVA